MPSSNIHMLLGTHTSKQCLYNQQQSTSKSEIDATCPIIRFCICKLACVNTYLQYSCQQVTPLFSTPFQVCTFLVEAEQANTLSCLTVTLLTGVIFTVTE